MPGPCVGLGRGQRDSGFLSPQESLPRAPQAGDPNAGRGARPGWSQSGRAAGRGAGRCNLASEPVVLVRKVRGCKPGRRNPHLRERPGVQSPGSPLGCQDSRCWTFTLRRVCIQRSCVLADFSVHTLHLLSLPVTFSLEGKGAVRGERELNFKFTRMHEHFFFSY